MKRFSEFIDWAIIAFLAFVVLSNSGCGDGPKPLPPMKGFETTQGVRVFVIQGESPTTEDLAEIDKQVSRIIEIAEKLMNRGYLWPKHMRHVIELVEPSPECETPGSFQTPAGQYGGTTICVAGRYYPTTDRIRTTLIAIRTMKIVQYESEHFGLKYNDEALYNASLTHVPPNAHPLFGVE